MKALILFAEERTWQDRTFRDVQYFEAMESMKEAKQKGVRALTITATPEAMEQILAVQLPAVFDMEQGARPNFRGDPVTHVIGAKLVKAVKVSDVVAA